MRLVSVLLASALLASAFLVNPLISEELEEKTALYIDELQQDPQMMQGFIGGTTFISWDDFHGTQVEYHQPNGQAWLVYPGNSAVLKGQWAFANETVELEICYMYYTLGSNPATGKQGFTWSCSPTIDKLYDATMTPLLGDVFKLQERGAFPQTLRFKDKLTVAEVAQIFGVSTNRLTNRFDVH